MAKLKIVEVPDARLKKISEPVKEINAEIQQLLDDMLETMYDAPGIGLAAVQVGVLKRVVVLDIAGKDEPPAPMFLINPEIIASSEELEECEEGCLSVPKQFATVFRPAEVTVKYLDRDGNNCQVKADGLLAVALQHEIDHLNGKVFIDYLSPLKRKILLRKLEKDRRFRENEPEEE
ncbi:MAG: peptide deformylase [Alphaproteobacteria bacterium]|nr:peptide deformylase [Alphaproteobacteria bacterium]